MNAIYLVENPQDIELAEAHADRCADQSALLYPVSRQDPYFFDAFEHPRLRRWDNSDSFLHIRHYDWIYKFREHNGLIAQALQQTPSEYAASLNFYLAYAFGHEQRVFSDYLSQFCQGLRAGLLYLRDLHAPYAACVHLIQPYRAVRIASYAG